MKTTHTHTMSFLLLAAVIGGGCDVEESDADFADTSGNYESTDTTDEDDTDDGLRAWTGFTSNEYPPLICPNATVVRGIDCTGGHCNNVSLDCVSTSGTIGTHSWTPYFSEEGSGTADEGHCWGTNEWMTGIACSGHRCDNISMRCTEMLNSTTGTCYWSGWYSEEQAPFVAQSGYYVKGIECSGDYCDNKRYKHCRKL